HRFPEPRKRVSVERHESSVSLTDGGDDDDVDKKPTVFLSGKSCNWCGKSDGNDDSTSPGQCANRCPSWSIWLWHRTPTAGLHISSVFRALPLRLLRAALLPRLFLRIPLLGR